MRRRRSLTGVSVVRIVPLRSASGTYGGPSDTALRQATLCAQGGSHVTLLSGYFKGDAPKEGFTNRLSFASAPVRILVPVLGFMSLFSISVMRLLFAQVRGAGVVHVSFSREPIALVAAAIAIYYRVPLILQPHGMLTARTSKVHRMLDLLVKQIYRRAHLVIALTMTEEKQLQRWANGFESPEIVCIANPFVSDPGAVLDHQQSDEALFLARLEPRKRVQDFAQAAAVSNDRRLSSKYTVVGPDQGDLQSIENLLTSVPSLSYEGPVPPEAVVDRLRRSGVFVLPSREEPWGNVLVLALAIGLPVIVTRSAALADGVERYKAGRVVPDNDPEAICEAVSSLLGKRDEWLRASQGALTLTARQFCQEVITDKLLAAYKLAIEQAGSSGR